MKAKCDQCGWAGDIDPIAITDIPGIDERLEPGGLVPVGECPARGQDIDEASVCGSLVYPTDQGYAVEGDNNLEAAKELLDRLLEFLEDGHTNPYKSAAVTKFGDEIVAIIGDPAARNRRKISRLCEKGRETIKGLPILESSDERAVSEIFCEIKKLALCLSPSTPQQPSA